MNKVIVQGVYMLPSTSSGTGVVLVIEQSRNADIDRRK